jgi:hypothetical protein
MLTITGTAAITYASAHWHTLSTCADPVSAAREGVSIEEARSIAREDPSLVYITIDGEQIATLRDEAAHAGDDALSLACERVLGGTGTDEDRRAVTRALVDAAAQVGT